MAMTILNVDAIRGEVVYGEYLWKIHEDIELDPNSHPHFSVIQGNLLYQDRLVISVQSTLIPTILQTYHDSVLGGHSG